MKSVTSVTSAPPTNKGNQSKSVIVSIVIIIAVVIIIIIINKNLFINIVNFSILMMANQLIST